VISSRRRVVSGSWLFMYSMHACSVTGLELLSVYVAFCSPENGLKLFTTRRCAVSRSGSMCTCHVTRDAPRQTHKLWGCSSAVQRRSTRLSPSRLYGQAKILQLGEMTTSSVVASLSQMTFHAGIPERRLRTLQLCTKRIALGLSAVALSLPLGFDSRAHSDAAMRSPCTSGTQWTRSAAESPLAAAPTGRCRVVPASPGQPQRPSRPEEGRTNSSLERQKAKGHAPLRFL
jgi:hypothetical protein